MTDDERLGYEDWHPPTIRVAMRQLRCEKRVRLRTLESAGLPYHELDMNVFAEDVCRWCGLPLIDTGERFIRASAVTRIYASHITVQEVPW